MKIKIYIAGKVSKDSVFGTSNWRENFCHQLSEKSGFEIVNLDPTKWSDNFNLDESNSRLIFGRDCFMIKSADLVVVNLTDDISVGGSQEMLIAKHYSKPLVGIAPKGGKFNKEEIEFSGKTYKDWIHPFVNISCDKIVGDLAGAAEFIKYFFLNPGQDIKNFAIVDEMVDYYKKEFYPKDTFLHF